MPRACVSTFDLPRSTKVSYWNDVTAEIFTPLEIKPERPQEFDATVLSSPFGDIRLARPISSPAAVRHDRRHIQRLKDQKFFLHMPVQASMQATYRRQEMVLNEGDMLLCDSTSPYGFVFKEPSEVIIAILSREQLERHLPLADEAAGLRIDGSRGFGKLAGDMLSSLWAASADRGLAHKLCERAANDFLSVFATACVAGGRGAGDGGRRTARRAQVRLYVDEHLREPDLSPASVSDALGISRRYLHLLFDDQDETVGAYILRRRLTACARQLADPLHQVRSITDMAFSWGFNHPTHFARVFRSRFGVSPSEYRASRLEDATASVTTSAEPA